MNDFFAELKRRNVVRVAIAYVVVSWVILQFVDVIQEIVAFPDWFPQMILVLLIIGLPLALIFSWAFEITPEGVKKTEEVDKSQSITHGTGQRINKLIIGGLGIAVALLLADRFIFKTGQAPVQVAEETAGEAQEEGTSIAVLPFVNLSSDAEQEYFSDGISEELLNVLVRVEGLSVASRTSAFAFKGQNPNIQDVAKQLNVDHVLEGSVRRSGDTIRITAQLIDGRTDRHLWSETYDREFADIFKIQDEISKAIVTALKDTLGIESMEIVSVAAKTENLSAYDLYLKGREFFIYRTDLPQSAALLEQAVALDDNFAAAWETLAATYAVMPSWGFLDRPYEELSEQAADKAIALDSNLSLAYAVKGNNLGLDDLVSGQGPIWKESFENLEKAIENNPNNATALLWRGINYLALGFSDKALDDFNACLKIDPGYGNCTRHKSVALLTKGQNREGLALYTDGLLAGYSVGAGGVVYINTYGKQGDDTTALLILRQVFDFNDFPFKAYLDAVKDPGGDQAGRWARLKRWAESQGGSENDFTTSTKFLFGRYDLINEAEFDYSYFIWWPMAKDFRQGDHFKRIAKTRNLPDYWQEFGFPPGCRAIGEDDFECD